jgi:hypothetical protein
MFGLTHSQEILNNTLSEHLYSTIEPMTMANQSIAMNVWAITSVNQPKVVIFLCPLTHQRPHIYKSKPIFTQLRCFRSSKFSCRRHFIVVFGDNLRSNIQDLLIIPNPRCFEASIIVVNCHICKNSNNAPSFQLEKKPHNFEYNSCYCAIYKQPMR